MRGVDVARISGALASALAGGSGEDVSLGSELGGTAAANNALSLLSDISEELTNQRSEHLEEVMTIGDLDCAGGGEIVCNKTIGGGGGRGGASSKKKLC